MGPHKSGCKDEGIMPYKYYFMAENNNEINFMTEKIWEPLLTETLCFYWGCPNLADWINPQAYIVLNLDNLEGSFQTVKQAILNNEWEKRLEIIRQEKQKVLEYFNFFPTLKRILTQDFKFGFKPTDEDIIYHKNFSSLFGKKIDKIYSCPEKINLDAYHIDPKLVQLFCKYNSCKVIHLKSKENFDPIKYEDLLLLSDYYPCVGDENFWISSSQNISIAPLKKEIPQLNIKIKCVNLLRRPDRKILVTKLLQERNLLQHCDFFTAVDGKNMTVTQEIRDLFKGNDFNSNPGAIGCALSHLTLWQELLRDNCDQYLILEDDIEMDQNISKKLSIILDLNLDYDLLFLGHHVNKTVKNRYDKKLEELIGHKISNLDLNLTVGGTFGYLIKKSGAAKLVQFIEKNGIKNGIDFLMMRYTHINNLKILEIMPQLIFSDYADGNNKVDSDIQYDGTSLI